MGLSAQQLDTLSGLLLTLEPGSNPLPALRSEVKDVSISRCDADDMRGEKPYRRLPSFDLFLVDAQSHCWQLVDDPAQASGVIVSARAK
jgi:hypothetical protein